MRFSYSFVLLYIFCVQFANAQTNISFNIDNYDNDTLIIGNYYGDRTLVVDTLFKSVDNFVLQSDTSLLDAGVYIALFRPNNEFVQFIVNEDDQEFEVNFTFGESLPPDVKGSIDNKLLNDYLIFLNKKQTERKEIQAQMDSTKDNTKLENRILELDQEVYDMQNKIITNHPNAITSDILKSNKRVDIPEFEGTTDNVRYQEYIYYRNHFFDHIDLSKPSNLLTPFLNNKIENYINKLVPQHPDSISVELDKLLKNMESAPKTYRFYLSHFLNLYANSNIIGFDAIYVHLINNYYAKNKASWASNEIKDKLIKNAKKLEPILIGKKAPNITLYKRDGSEINVHDIDATFTVMIFWAPTCGHCKKSMPSLKEFYKKYKPLGVEVLAICTKHRDKVKACWDMVDDKELVWINAVDTFHKSNFREIYNVISTPRIFILDKDKKILLKRVPTDKLDSIMKELFKELDQAIIDQSEKK